MVIKPVVRVSISLSWPCPSFTPKQTVALPYRCLLRVRITLMLSSQSRFCYYGIFVPVMMIQFELDVFLLCELWCVSDDSVVNDGFFKNMCSVSGDFLCEWVSLRLCVSVCNDENLCIMVVVTCTDVCIPVTYHTKATIGRLVFI